MSFINKPQTLQPIMVSLKSEGEILFHLSKCSDVGCCKNFILLVFGILCLSPVTLYFYRFNHIDFKSGVRS